jgi:hypothetical protein
MMLFAGKWMELENCMLSEVSQVQKAKGHMCFPMWKTAPKINTNAKDHTHINMEHICNSAAVSDSKGGGREKER